MTERKNFPVIMVGKKELTINTFSFGMKKNVKKWIYFYIDTEFTTEAKVLLQRFSDSEHSNSAAHHCSGCVPTVVAHPVCWRDWTFTWVITQNFTGPSLSTGNREVVFSTFLKIIIKKSSKSTNKFFPRNTLTKLP